MTFRDRVRGTVSLLRQWGRTSGRDVVATTRDSFVSLEGRAGVAVFVGLWALGRWQAGPWTLWGPELGGEIIPDVRVWYAGRAVAGQAALLGVHVVLGAAWGLAAKNAGRLIARWRPRLSIHRDSPVDTGLPSIVNGPQFSSPSGHKGSVNWNSQVHRLKPWIGGVFSGGAVLAGHGILLARDVARHPALYQETFLDRGGWAAGFQRAALSPDSAPWATAATGLVALWVALAAVELAIRFYRWWMGFSRPTRLAITVLGGALGVFAGGVRGVRWVQAERNGGPNLLLISVDGWRTPLSVAAGDVSGLEKNGRGPRARAGAAAPSADLSPVLATALTGVSPLVHGIRHDFVSAGDGLRGVETLPDLFRKGGWTTVLLADGPTGFLDRMAEQFDQRRVASSHAGARLGRRWVERSPHLLPYLSGRWGRRLGLRGSVLMADPALLAREADEALGALSKKSKFFLWVHFSSPGSSCALASPGAARRAGWARDRFFRRPGRGFDDPPLTQADELALRRFYGASLRETHAGIRRIFAALARRKMDASTAVIVWSPRAALLSSDEMARARKLEGPAFEALPFYLWEGPFPETGAPAGIDGPRRAVDVAPTAARLAGLDIPSSWEGVSLTENPPTGESGVILAESADPNEPVASQVGLPSRWAILVEDRFWPGRFCRSSSWEDPFLVFRDRTVRLGPSRVTHRPVVRGVEWTFESVAVPPTATPGARARAYQERTRELKDVFFRALAPDSGWRPQNDYWIPESFLRERPLPLVSGEEDSVRRRRPRFWTDSK